MPSKPEVPLTGIERLLVFRIGHLGDTLVSLPAFWQIRDYFKNAAITLLSNIDSKNPSYISPRTVLPKVGLFDDFIDYPSGLTGLRSKLDLVGLAGKIRLRNFDAVVYLMNRFRTRVQIERDIRFFRLAGIRNVLGVRYLLENLIVPGSTNAYERIAPEWRFFEDCLAHDCMMSGRTGHTGLLLGIGEIEVAKSWFESATGAELSDLKLIAVGPGSKWPSKVWNREKFLRVVEVLIDRFNVFPVVLGGPEDAETGEFLISRCGRGVVAAGHLSVRESAALLAACNLYLGNDTGTMHLAASVGTPCVSIFAAIDYAGRWEPVGTRNYNFRRDVECSGCHTPDCFNFHKCLELVDETAVISACIEILRYDEVQSSYNR